MIIYERKLKNDMWLGVTWNSGMSRKADKKIEAALCNFTYKGQNGIHNPILPHGVGQSGTSLGVMLDSGLFPYQNRIQQKSYYPREGCLLPNIYNTEQCMGLNLFGCESTKFLSYPILPHFPLHIGPTYQ